MTRYRDPSVMLALRLLHSLRSTHKHKKVRFNLPSWKRWILRCLFQKELDNTLERLSQANGALEDILSMVTDGVGKNDPAEVIELATCVLERVLTSSGKVHSRPGWFQHDWERALYDRYDKGDLKACETEVSCKEHASYLMENGLSSNVGTNLFLNGKVG